MKLHPHSLNFSLAKQGKNYGYIHEVEQRVSTQNELKYHLIDIDNTIAVNFKNQN